MKIYRTLHGHFYVHATKKEDSIIINNAKAREIIYKNLLVLDKDFINNLKKEEKI